MSIAAYIDEPINEKEDNFYIPVSTENFFKLYWKPGCEALNLRWVSLFDVGVDITKDDVSEVISELKQLQIWFEQNLSNEQTKHLKERIELLISNLPSIFERDDVSLFIG